MSVKFQFSNTKTKEDLLFFRKSRGGPPCRASLRFIFPYHRPITEEVDEAEQHPKMHKGVVIEVKERLDHGF
jgi:hypothetical protein